jgi:hypothetical protein
MERQSSPVWSTVPELNGSEGADPSGWGVALGSGEPLGPAYGERGGVRWLGMAWMKWWKTEAVQR